MMSQVRYDHFQTLAVSVEGASSFSNHFPPLSEQTEKIMNVFRQK
jgi:hypothetical protein